MRFSTTLRRAARLISGPGAWQQFTLGYCAQTGSDAGCYCAWGALDKAAERDVYPDYESRGTVSGEALAEFNDAPDTTQTDVVMALLFEAEFQESEGR